MEKCRPTCIVAANEKVILKIYCIQTARFFTDLCINNSLIAYIL
jgi:hypothetical protein